MPLSISNRTHISQQELDAIGHWNVTSEVLVVNMAAEGGPKIERLSKDDLNCWQLFLRFFNMGKLAKKQIHISEIAAYLNQYDWGAVSVPASIYYPAYSKVCVLANKVLILKWDETLLNNVSLPVPQRPVEFAQFRGKTLLNKHKMGQAFRWNPALQVKHVQAFLLKQFPKATVRVEDEDRHLLSPETYLGNNDITQVKVYIDQQWGSFDPFEIFKTAMKS